MSDISNQLIKDSYNYVLQSDLSTGNIYRVGGGIPVNPIFLSGLTINTSFKYSDGSEQPGYVLTSDGYGNATWSPVSGSSSGNYLSLSGGTVTGPTIFTNGLTADTISATTYYNLPQDIYVTGGTYSAGTAIFTNNTGGTFNVTGFVSNQKIILKKIDLGTRLINGLGNVVVNLVNVWDRLTNSIIGKQPYYSGVKVDYYFTYNNPNNGIRTKELWTTQTFNVNLNTSFAFSGICNYISQNYETTLVNFYCEIYLNLNQNYLSPTQVRLTNPLFNSLNPYKYSRGKNYTGEAEFVRSNNNLPKSLNSIENNFIGGWQYYYDVGTSEDIVKKVYDIISTPEFYGPFSAESQSTLIFDTPYSNESREVIKNSVYVETLTGFYSKFKIPVNQHGFFESCVKLFNNFYGNLLYDIVSGSTPTINSHASIDGYNSSSFYQMIDTYRIYPKGTPGIIYYTGNFKLNDLLFSMGIDKNLKYIGKFRQKSYVQVLPYYQNVYILKISVNGDNNPQLFINNLINNYLQINDSSLKNSIIDNNPNHYWTNGHYIYMANENYFYNDNPYGPYLVIQSTDEKMYQLSQNPIFSGVPTPAKIYVGGSFASYNGISSSKIIRLNDTGGIDLYESPGFLYDIVNDIKIQNDGKILAGGSFTSYNGTGANNIIRLNSDGSVDSSFVYGSGFSGSKSGEVNIIKIQSDGKILVGGYFTDYNGTGANRIIRLNSDGSVDSSFVYGSGFNDYVLTIAIQSDGKILVGGYFANYNGTGANYIIRLNSDGSVDSSFVYGSGFGGPVRTIAIQSDGKILVGGYFLNYNGTVANKIIRLNSDGSIDSSFVYGSGFGGPKVSVKTIAIQSDGKILAGGDFTNYNGTGANYIIKLNSDGSVDSSFVYGSGFDDYVQTIAIQSDGKILVGGYFANYNGTVANKIIRLNSDGSVDSSFVYSSGFDNYVHIITTTPIVNPSINVDAIYKGTSFKPFIYPLNLNQLTLEVPVTDDNNQFFMDGTKELRFIIKYIKLQQYDVSTTQIEVTTIRNEISDNKFFTLTLSTNDSFESTVLGEISYTNRKQFRPGNVEIYLSFFDTNTNETSLIPNYKIIIAKYGDNEVFKLIKGSNVINI
jgi:uncharacterized delta-60 repeat protein